MEQYIRQLRYMDTGALPPKDQDAPKAPWFFAAKARKNVYSPCVPYRGSLYCIQKTENLPPIPCTDKKKGYRPMKKLLTFALLLALCCVLLPALAEGS